MTRLRGARLLVVALLAVALAPWPSSPGAASCVGPTLTVEGDREPPRVDPGAQLTVAGRYFVVGCNDVGSVGVFGCSSGEPEPEPPMTDVTLVIRQGAQEWELGTQDAGAADETLGQITWATTLPPELKPGRAVLLAGTARLKIRVADPGA